MHHGSCLCGAVSFDVDGELPAPDACHCSICRKQSSACFVSSDVPRKSITLRGGDKVTWFKSSEKVRRGFCSTCGSPLFFDPLTGKDWMGISMGAFEKPTGTRIGIHVFVGDKGDYYDITDGIPQKQ